LLPHRRKTTMGRRVSTEARRELVVAVAERCQGGRRSEKVRILDEFVAVTTGSMRFDS
jgi:hypothetical protein